MLGLSLAGGKHDLLVRMADFMLTEKGLRTVKQKLPASFVASIYENEIDSDEDAANQDAFMSNLDKWNEKNAKFQDKILL